MYNTQQLMTMKPPQLNTTTGQPTEGGEYAQALAGLLEQMQANKATPNYGNNQGAGLQNPYIGLLRMAGLI